MHGELTALAFIAIGGASFAYVFYLSRRQRLEERERAVLNSMDKEIFDGKPLAEGFIFAQMWRVSNIYNEAGKMGFVFQATDILGVVRIIKDNFTPEEGINARVIREAIALHVDAKLSLEHMRADTKNILKNDERPQVDSHIKFLRRLTQ